MVAMIDRVEKYVGLLYQRTILILVSALKNPSSILKKDSSAAVEFN